MSLLEQFDQLRATAYAALDSDRSSMGQYFTPVPIASLLASMVPATTATSVSVIDPGAGVGMLSAAAVVRLESFGVKRIDLTVCELAPEVLPALREGMTLLKEWCATKDIDLEVTIIEQDFIAWAVERLAEGELFTGKPPRFDLAILNPPYKKISTSSLHRHLLRRAGLECTNLYAAFIYLAAKALKKGGDLISINPRSFASGPYFSDFRQQIFTMASLQAVHLFDRRDQAFSADKVLQENVVMHLVRGVVAPTVSIMSSIAGESGNHGWKIPLERVIDPKDAKMVLHLETTEADANVSDLIRALPAKLADIGVKVSTGRVVEFRAKEALAYVNSPDAVPLIYPQHLREATVVWPKQTKKPDYFRPGKLHRASLVPAGTYVLTKRFTSKEEKRRVSAFLITTKDVSAKHYAFENHVNYFHANGEPLDDDLARGLAAFLNSNLVDHYFRLYNGHTQVNATDLRALPYPPAKALRKLGQRLEGTHLVNENVDQHITELCRDYAENEDQGSAVHAGRPGSSPRAA